MPARVTVAEEMVRVAMSSDDGPTEQGPVAAKFTNWWFGVSVPLERTPAVAETGIVEFESDTELGRGARAMV